MTESNKRGGGSSRSEQSRSGLLSENARDDYFKNSWSVELKLAHHTSAKCISEPNIILHTNFHRIRYLG